MADYITESSHQGLHEKYTQIHCEKKAKGAKTWVAVLT